jgi:hypothetical protein
METPKARSVTADGEPDGFEIPAGFQTQVEDGMTRLLISVPTKFLPTVHADLIRAAQGPMSVLYRQRIDRLQPRPEGAPPRDFLGIDLDAEVVITAFAECADLVYHDARAELWVRGRRGEQIVLDGDGLIYCYPDDPSFRDACLANGLAFGPVQTLLHRDYVRQYFHAACDALEAGLIDGLGLSEMPG